MLNGDAYSGLRAAVHGFGTFFLFALQSCRLSAMETSAILKTPSPSTYTHTDAHRFFISFTPETFPHPLASLPPPLPLLSLCLLRLMPLSLTRWSCFLCESCQQDRRCWCHLCHCCQNIIWLTFSIVPVLLLLPPFVSWSFSLFFLIFLILLLLT